MKKFDDHINVQIMDNELGATDWELNDLVWDLAWWVQFFNNTFFREHPVPLPALSFEKTRVDTMGHYRIGRNDFAVKENINLNRVHLARPKWELLATLLHEMTHSWEYFYLPKEERTNNWYHKKCFRSKLASFGILTDERGCHVSVSDPFVHLLRQHGVTFEIPGPGMNTKTEIVVPDRPKPKGKSKLKKWSCGCTNVRVAIVDFQAVCLKCGKMFEKNN